MLTNAQMVEEFHHYYKHPVAGPMTPEALAFRWKLVCEEADEVFEELYKGVNLETGEKAIDVEKINRPKLTKEVADLLYVTYGMAVNFGLPIDEAFKRVHQSNMSKLGRDKKPIYNEDGKVMKGPDYQPPNIEELFDGDKPAQPIS